MRQAASVSLVQFLDLASLAFEVHSRRVPSNAVGLSSKLPCNASEPQGSGSCIHACTKPDMP